MKNILIINGHPNKQSFNHSLAEAYKNGVELSQAIISKIDICDLDFNPNLQYGYSKRMELEPDLKVAMDKIKNADHIVWVYPMWWYGYPAMMKGFVDRTFLPDFAFKTRKGKQPEKLLKGKTGRIIITSDTPKWYDYFFMRSPAINQFKKGTLEFCGISPVKTTYISPIKHSTSKFREKWLKKVQKLGSKLN